jgi:drug/metabolite transporter (DMT)-like permease
VPTVVVLAAAVRAPWVPRERASWWALLAGPLGASATGAFLLASQSGYLTIAGVLSSLYPATTVLLAAVLLRERIHRGQGLGLGLCAVAVALVAGG